jgi:2'-5' RNA ligase
MRLFIALELDDRTRDRLQEAQSALETARTDAAPGQRLSLTRREHMHLTLAFLGEVPPDRLDDVRAALSEVRSEPDLAAPLRLTLEGIGSFPQREGRVWWVGVRGDRALTDLQRRLVEGLVARGFAPDARPYRPHLTIAREADTGPDIPPPGVACGAGPPFPAAEALGVRATLFESTRLQGRLTHIRIE